MHFSPISAHSSKVCFREKVTGFAEKLQDNFSNNEVRQWKAGRGQVDTMNAQSCPGGDHAEMKGHRHTGAERSRDSAAAAVGL